MNKKGFTLVELLAVIAILAILVIVAMPNVLGMFNQAKSSTFITEVQEYMKAAQTAFMTESLKPGNSGRTLRFGSATYTEGGTTKNFFPTLDMSGGEKQYYIKMSRNGVFNRVIVFDDNFCYDSGNGAFEYTEITKITIDKLKESNKRNDKRGDSVTPVKTSTYDELTTGFVNIDQPGEIEFPAIVGSSSWEIKGCTGTTFVE